MEGHSNANINSNELADARDRAAADFFANILKTKLKEIQILSSKLLMKSNNLWIEVNSANAVKTVFARAATVKAHTIKLNHAGSILR